MMTPIEMRPAASAYRLGPAIGLPLLALSQVLSAADVTVQLERLEEVEVVGQRNSALEQAPSQSRLDALEPQSIISLEHIANSVAATADFATIANLAPGVSNVETNGPGLSEAKHLTMRGFDDNSYNVTYDGIPFGDQNDWSHHTTSYFPAKLIGKVVVDRGPGTASTIGQATFGGTLAMYSKDPRDEMTGVPTLSSGSWNTRLEHIEINSGTMQPLSRSSVIASYQKMTTDGYRSYSDMDRDTYYFKYQQPLGATTTLTLLSTYNKIHFSNPGTVTQQQIDTLGRNYGLSNDPVSTDYRGYNYQDKKADFEYIGIESKPGDAWEFSNKMYTYYYNNESRESPKTKTVTGVVNYIGSFKVNRYRNFGDYFIATHTDRIGKLKAGFWVDYTRNPRYLYGLNYSSTGNSSVDRASATNQFAPVAANPSTAVGAPNYNYSYNMVERARTLQGFTEYEWHAGSALTVNAGLKYFRFQRDIEAQVNQTKARKPLYFAHTDAKTLPYLSANYLISPEWSVYGQVAQGLLSPNLNQFYVDVPDSNTIKPGQTTNYQTGTVYKTTRLNAAADIYYIDFKNYAYKGPTNSSGDPIYIGVAQGAKYNGAEVEATYYLGGGFSLYGNGSVANATFKGSNLDVPTVPRNTAALGFVYDHGGFFSSLTDKYVGSWVVYDTLTNPDVAGGGATRSTSSSTYSIADLSLGYGMKMPQHFLQSFKVRLQVSNLFDTKVQVLNGIDALSANSYTKDAFNVLPERNYFVTLSAEL
jgi:iron complex outermembrane receptor protein